MVQLVFRTFTLLNSRIINQIIQSASLQRQMCGLSAKFYCHSSDKTDAEDETHSTNYINTESDYGFGRRYVVKKLGELFKIKHADAYDIAVRHKELWQVNGKLMTDNYNLCKKEDVANDILLKCPTILAQKDLQQKINCLKMLWLPISTTIPLTILNLKYILNNISNDPVGFLNRIYFLSQLMELPEDEVCFLLTKKTFLGTINLEKAERNYKLILDYGIPKEELHKDLWALRYNTDVIKERLEAARKANLEKLKTWMIRSDKTIFETYIKRRTENKKILGESSLIEYLAERLECTSEQVQVIIKKHPALENKSMPKLKAAIDFLYSAGFESFQIVRAPKILLHSVETTKKRLEELHQKGVKVDSLYILTKSQKQYMRYYEFLINRLKSRSSNLQQ